MRQFAKRLLMVAGAVMLSGTLAAMVAPKAAHAVVSALVTVTNTSANPVPATLPTHIGLPPSKFVTLNCSFATICNSFSQVMPDGTTSPFTIPTDEQLVITDLDWTSFNGVPGETIQVFLQALCSSCASQPFVLVSTGLANADGHASQSEHMTSGVVLSRLPSAQLQTSSELYVLNLHGYLVP
jgi:hypothetical protein